MRVYPPLRWLLERKLALGVAEELEFLEAQRDSYLTGQARDRLLLRLSQLPGK